MRKKDERNAAANALIRSVFRASRGRAALVAAGRVLQGLMYLAFVLLSRDLIDSAVAGNMPGVAGSGSLLVALVLLRIGVNYGLNLLNRATSYRAAVRLRTDMYAEILGKKQLSISEHHSAALLERLMDDVPDIVSYPLATVPSFIGSLTGLVGAVWALFWMNRLLPAALILAGALLSGVGRLFQRRMKDNFKAYSAANEQSYAYYQETLSNSLMLKVFRALPQASARAEAFESAVFGKWKRWFRYNQMLRIGVSSFFQLGYLGAMVFCAVLLSSGGITYGAMTAILQLVGEIQDPFSSLGDLMSARYHAQAAAERLAEIRDLPAEKADAARDGWALYADMQEISIRGLCFSYDERAVLADACATLRKGEFVVISGPSGVGKSTLLWLMLGVYERYTGRMDYVARDGNRVPLDESTRALFSYVPQKHMVFSGTVRDNLCFLCGQADDARIWEAARRAEAEGFLRELPRGLDTPLGEQGQGLSEGQAQRLAIARALLANAPILVLDEATSALDERTEQRVLTNIRALGDISLLIISHRRAAFDVCDREWRMAGGRIEERVLRHDR